MNHAESSWTSVALQLLHQLLGRKSSRQQARVLGVAVWPGDLRAREQRHHLAVPAFQIAPTLPPYAVGQLRYGERLRPQRRRIQTAGSHTPVLPVEQAEPRARDVCPVQIPVSGAPFLHRRGRRTRKGRPDDLADVSLSDHDGVRGGHPRGVRARQGIQR
ncbi:hypothetical protein SBRY_30825 [Actinacidiphila bryophytorum]|uniref:Uncharacterized protein n=1 Tax=Actinacidiphila bryophytorum TaxID=1436133 RepID=A0A9W4H1V7_9ACTN|nr:hypothetical protein SBRY_30825 [Actinacidiphila bryophytorum]